MPLPDEELAQIRSAGAGVVLERRSARRDGAPAPVSPAMLEPLAIERPVGPVALRTPGPARFAPLAGSVARALEPALGAARVMSERIHRQRDEAVDLLAEARALEDAGAGEAAFFAFGRALLAAPLDASAVRPLERLAAAHDRQLELAELYESVVAAVASHPSAATLQRRAAQLRAADTPAGVPVASALAAADGSAAAGNGACGEAAFTMRPSAEEPEGARGGRQPSSEGEEDRSHAARQVPLFSPPDDPAKVPVGARMLAWAIDGVLLFAIPFASIAAASAAFARPGLSRIDQLHQMATQSASLTGATLLLVLLVAFVYLTLGLAIGGRTLGDRIAGLRSVDVAHGGPPDLPTAALRSALAIAGTLAFLAGPLWALVDAEGRSLHDKVAGTRTVRC